MDTVYEGGSGHSGQSEKSMWRVALARFSLLILI